MAPYIDINTKYQIFLNFGLYSKTWWLHVEILFIILHIKYNLHVHFKDYIFLS